jgi:hypothetical protein
LENIDLLNAPKEEDAMKKIIAMTTLLFLGLLMIALPSNAGQDSGCQISKIIEYKASLKLTDSQIKKLEQVQENVLARMAEAKRQSDIRLGEIEKFSSNWTAMNSVAVMDLIKEYYKFLTDYKTAELEAVIRARAILNIDQLAKFQQLASIEMIMIKMQDKLASR